MTDRQKKVVKQYKGRLSAKQAATGMNAAIRNASRLASDARLLLEAGRHASALSLAALAIEEVGKVSILRGLAAAQTDSQVKALWADYRNHRAKNGLWILPDLMKKGARKLSEFASCLDKDGEHTAILDAVKQIGFYTDCLGDSHWSVPENVIEQSLAAALVKIAELFAGKDRKITEREIEIWVEIMGPVYGTPDMAGALLRYHEALKKEGLTTTPDKEVVSFVDDLVATHTPSPTSSVSGPH